MVTRVALPSGHQVRRRLSVPDVLIHVLAVLLILVMLYPFLYVLAVSLSSASQIHGMNVTFFPKGLTFDTYRYIFQNAVVITGYENSVLYTVVFTALSLALTVLCAYPLSRQWLFGRRTVLVLITITMFVNMGIIPQFLVLNKLGLYDTRWAVLAPNIVSTFLVLVTINFFKGIPSELLDAGYVDGAGDLGALFRIVLPLSKPILATVALFQGVYQWNSWFSAAVYLNDASKFPIQLVLRNLMASTGFGQTSTASGSLAGASFAENPLAINYALTIGVVLPIIFLYPFAQRYLIKGLTVGSLKG